MRPLKEPSTFRSPAIREGAIGLALCVEFNQNYEQHNEKVRQLNR